MSILKPVLILGGLYFAYEWAKGAGLFGAQVQTFSNSPDLLTYCKANPTLSAGITGQGNAPCAQWLQAVSTPPQGGTSIVQTQSPPPQIDQNLAAQLTNMMQSSQNRTVGTISEWNWLYQHLKNDPNAPILDGTSQAEQQFTISSQIDAPTYLQTRIQAGLSGLGYYSGIYIRRPLSRYVN